MLPIAQFEKRYAITKKGEVINLATNLPLKPRQNKNGYLIVTLAMGKEGHAKQIAIHSLVALHYLPNPYGYKQVNHKNGDKTYNYVDNIEWCSAKQNVNHALKTGLRPGYMSANDKDTLIRRVFHGELIKDLAKEIGRREESLSAMLRYRAQATNLGSTWKENMRRRRSERTALRNKGLI